MNVLSVFSQILVVSVKKGFLITQIHVYSAQT